MNSSNIKKYFMPLFLALCLAVAAAVEWDSLFVSPPEINLVFITLDTTRADHVGCYGYAKKITPNIDRLAAESVVFERAVSQAAVTPVSHASMFTGLEPYHHGLRVLHGLVANRLDPKQTTLAEVWKKAGGRTAAFVSAFPVTGIFGLDQGFDLFDDDFMQAESRHGVVSQKGTVNTGRSQRRADYTTSAAVKWLNSTKNHKDPFFMWVHYFDPHDPLIVPPEEIMNSFYPATGEKEDVLKEIYDCEIFFMDSQIGRLFAELKKQGIWDRTMVVVVADHGEGLGDHNWWTHGILYQEQIHVPLIIKTPYMAGAEKVSSLVRCIDIMPTILELSGINRSLWPEMDGMSLRFAMETGRTEQALTAYSDSVNILTYGRMDNSTKLDRKHDKLYCLISGSHKLIYHQLEPEDSEFYNLTDDPSETDNIAWKDLPQMKALIARLAAIKALSPVMPGMTPSDFSRIQRLKELGYVQ